MMFSKVFTPSEANQRLPLVRRIVTDILRKGTQLLALVEKHQKEPLPKEYYKIKSEVEELMSELESLGCYFKDWNFQIGLVDFPAIIDGEEVLLCWRSDEEEIRWYHGVDDGYAGRRLIPEHLLV